MSGIVAVAKKQKMKQREYPSTPESQTRKISLLFIYWAVGLTISQVLCLVYKAQVGGKGRRQNAEPYSMEYPMDYPNGVP